MTTEHEIEGTLRSLAEVGGPPDEAAAWQAITAGIAADDRRRRRSRFVAGGLVTAAAAAGLVVAVAVGSADDVAEPIDIGPAEPGETTAPPTTDAAPTPSAAALPADPIVVISEDREAVRVIDGETGEVVATPVTSSEELVVDAAISVDGTVFVVGPERLSAARWDEVNALRPMRALEGQGSFGPLAVSPDGMTLAVSVLDDQGMGSLLIDDLRTDGPPRRLEFPPESGLSSYEQPQGLSFSPDGRRLAFVNAHDNDGTEGFDGIVVDVDAASLAEAEQIGGELWDITFTPDGGILVLEGDTAGTATLRFIAGGPDVGIPPLDHVSAIRATDHAVYALTDDGAFRHELGSERWEPVALPGYW